MGDYQRGQILKFESWVERHHAEDMGSEKEKVIARVKAEMADFDNGPKYLHGYVAGEGALRNRIVRLARETNIGMEGAADKVADFGLALAEAAKIIKKDAEWEIEPFDLGVAVRFRFILSFEEEFSSAGMAGEED